MSQHSDPSPSENTGWTLLSESLIFPDSKKAIRDIEPIIGSIRSLALEIDQEAQIQEVILKAVKSARSTGSQNPQFFPTLIQIWITGLNPIIFSDMASDIHPDAQQVHNRVGIYLIEKTLDDLEITYRGACRVIDVRIYGQ